MTLLREAIQTSGLAECVETHRAVTKSNENRGKFQMEILWW